MMTPMIAKSTHASAKDVQADTTALRMALRKHDKRCSDTCIASVDTVPWQGHWRAGCNRKIAILMPFIRLTIRRGHRPTAQRLDAPVFWHLPARLRLILPLSSGPPPSTPLLTPPPAGHFLVFFCVFWPSLLPPPLSPPLLPLLPRTPSVCPPALLLSALSNAASTRQSGLPFRSPLTLPCSLLSCPPRSCPPPALSTAWDQLGPGNRQVTFEEGVGAVTPKLLSQRYSGTNLCMATAACSCLTVDPTPTLKT